MPHTLNFVAGWWLVLAAFLSGAAIGLGFHREDFLGGYGSFRRRLLRLGHLALAALGILNLVYGVSPLPRADASAGGTAGVLLVAGAVAMPAVCFLTAWRPIFRHGFFIPVTLLIGAVGLIIYEVSP